MKKLLLTASLLMFATQASAWVSKGFVPAKVDIFTVDIDDQANDGCWTNIGEVKRYAEDKLELAGFKVSREKFEGYEDKQHFLFGIVVIANRINEKCYGNIKLEIVKGIYDNKIAGMFVTGEAGANFTGYENANRYTLELVGDFIKEVEDPQW